MLFRNIAAGALASLAFAGSSGARMPSRSASSTRFRAPLPTSASRAAYSADADRRHQCARRPNRPEAGAVALDSKANPAEALIAFKQLTIRACRFFSRATPRPSPGRWSDATAKHNSRNPDNTICFLNYGAVRPALTNDAALWHFRSTRTRT